MTSNSKATILRSALAAMLVATPIIATSPSAMAQQTAAQKGYGTEVGKIVEAARNHRLIGEQDRAIRRGDADPARAQLAEFAAMIEASITPALIREANDMSDRKMKLSAQRAERYAQGVLTRLQTQNFDRRIEYTKDLGGEFGLMTVYIQKIYLRDALSALQKLYPNTPVYGEALSILSEQLSSLGSVDNVEAMMANVKAEKAAVVALRPARQNNLALARQFEQAFRASPWNQKEYKGASILKTNLFEGGWTVERNPVTGIIVSRYQRASMGIRRADGVCVAYEVLFEQKAAGGGRYGGVYMRSGTDREMLCDNI